MLSTQGDGEERTAACYGAGITQAEKSVSDALQ